MAINPQLVAGDGGRALRRIFRRIKSIEGVRLPGERRHKNRLDKGPAKSTRIIRTNKAVDLVHMRLKS